MEFRILGPLEVWDEGHQIPVPGERQRTLLAFLLVHANELLSVDRLIDELWEERPPGSGAKALRVRVSQLRKVLPGGVLETRPPGYLLRIGSEQLDLHRFERLAEDGKHALEAGDPAGAAASLQQALALWRGPPLADVPYPRFAQAAGARLEELRLGALELRVEADLLLGRHAEVVAELEQLVDLHPLRERPRGQLMLALYRSGRQAEALASYRVARRILVDELGMDPSPALQELERQILRQDASLDVPVTARPAVGRPAERSILVAGFAGVEIERLLAVAEPLARDPPRVLFLALAVAADTELATASALLQEHRAELEARGLEARVATFTSAAAGSDVGRLAGELDVDLTLVEAPTTFLTDGLPDEQLAALLAEAPCDVALVVPRTAERTGVVLVPFGGVEHDWAAVELAAWLARAGGFDLRLVGATAVGGKRDASRLLSHASLAVQRVLGVPAEPVLVPPGEEGVLDAAREASVLVVGLSSRWHRDGLGSARLRLAREAVPPTLLVRRGLRPGGLAPPAALTRFTWSIRG
jgi:DNA-binding SARP family transcriptional activator